MTNRNRLEESDLNVGPVDFAIVTALKIERDAMLARLEGGRKIQDDFDPYTYYRGYVTIPGSAERYEVVLVMLLDMGNDEAAVATTQMIQRWQPHSVIMMGIAGGVRGKVSLGDVVVANYAHYYEAAKQTPHGEQRRPLQFSSDRLLYGRALAYEASEWKGDINIPRPGAEETKLPDAHFGAIGCGEKVIADAEALAQLLRECPKMIAVAMEGAGVARAATNHASKPRFLEVRGISDYADPQKDDDWHSFAAAATAAFTVGFLRSRPIPPLTQADSFSPAKKAPLVILTAQSLRPISVDELLGVFETDLSGRDIESVSLDFTDLLRGGAFTDPQEGARRLANPQGKLLGSLARRGEAELVFHGLVHIPLAFLIGHLVSDRQPVRLFDFHPSPGSNSWAWPEKTTSIPQLQVREHLTVGPPQLDEAVIRISVSYPVSPEQTEAIIKGSVASFDLTVLNPERSLVQSEEQTWAYGQVFRQVIDRISQGTKLVKRIHIFYAGPVALAFHLGQQISENIHPPVVVWNYRYGYEWGINLAAAATGEDCIVYPKDFEGEALASEEDQMFMVVAWLTQMGREKGADVWTPEIGSEDHKLAEKMAQLGMLDRVSGIPGYYSLPGKIRFPR